MSAIVRYPCVAALGASVFSAFLSRLGFVSFTICSQKSTKTRLSWKIVWSNMYSAGFAEVVDPLCQVRHADAVRHILRVDRTRRVIVAADTADPTADEVRVARVLAFHEDAVAAEDRRRASALDDFAVVEVDLGVDSQVPNDARDRVPGHADELARFGSDSLLNCHFGDLRAGS